MSSPLPRDWRPDRPDLLDLHCSCIEPWGTVGNGREPWAAKSLKSIKNASVYAGQKRLRIGCSTTELPRPLIIKDLFPRSNSCVKLASNLRCKPIQVSALPGRTFNHECTASSEATSAPLIGDYRVSAFHDALTFPEAHQGNRSYGK